MARRWTNDLTWADVTSKPLWLNRQIMAGAGGLGASALAGPAAAQEVLEPNTLEEITTYNNFYEFGYEKADPSIHADDMDIEPWSI